MPPFLGAANTTCCGKKAQEQAASQIRGFPVVSAEDCNQNCSLCTARGMRCAENLDFRMLMPSNTQTQRKQLQQESRDTAIQEATKNDSSFLAGYLSKPLKSCGRTEPDSGLFMGRGRPLANIVLHDGKENGNYYLPFRV